MSLSKSRRNEIAWNLLVYVISKRSVQNARLENLHKELCACVSSEHPMQTKSLCWQFCKDLSDKVFMDPNKDSMETRYELSQEERHSFSYSVLLALMESEGVRLNTKTKREVGNYAQEIDVEIDEMLKFMRGLLKELVCKVLHSKQ